MGGGMRVEQGSRARRLGPPPGAPPAHNPIPPTAPPPRSCRRKTYEAEGLPRVSALALANCADLLPLVAWNAAHGIHFFRIPSALFPWSHEYELEQLPGGCAAGVAWGGGG